MIKNIYKHNSKVFLTVSGTKMYKMKTIFTNRQSLYDLSCIAFVIFINFPSDNKIKLIKISLIKFN